MVSYQALLFVPSARPFDLYDPERRHGVKLYVRRVFITDDLEGLMPRYLRFVRGVVDSEDLQLNVSRETLQHSAVLARIRKDLIKRLLDELERRAKAEDGGYASFWDQFGAVLKEGLYEDHEHRERLLELARFRTTARDGWVGLADYVARMKPGQDAIYTISGEHLEALRSSPQLEACRAKGVEVLLLADPIDEFWLPAVPEYQGKRFRSLTRGEVDLSKIEASDGEAEETAPDAVAGAELDRLIAVFKAPARRQVKDVRPSARLTESAVCLVADEHAHRPAPRALPEAAPAARGALQARARDQPQARADPADGGARGPGRRGRGAGRPRRAAARSGADRRGRALARPGRLLPPPERLSGQRSRRVIWLARERRAALA